MNRRSFIKSVGTSTAVGSLTLAGCVSTNSDENSAGGPIYDGVEKKNIQLLEEKDMTIVDVIIKGRFSCSHADPEDEVFNITIISKGERLQTKQTTIGFENCMIEQTGFVSFKIDGLHAQVTITGKPAPS